MRILQAREVYPWEGLAQGSLVVQELMLNGGFFKSRMTFEKATLNLRTFRSASCGTQEARENARGLSKLTEF
jgi:hypothetical protein